MQTYHYLEPLPRDGSRHLSPGGRFITASEIGTYLYCNRAWWLDKVGGYQPVNVEEMEVGEIIHEKQGQRIQVQVQTSSRLRQVAIALLILAVLIVLIWLIVR
jgi:CRISPR/Cas system-associated exonuclease Cas4 (RecB family)